MGFRETNKHNWGAHIVDIQYLHLQCGAPPVISWFINLMNTIGITKHSVSWEFCGPQLSDSVATGAPHCSPYNFSSQPSSRPGDTHLPPFCHAFEGVADFT